MMMVSVRQHRIEASQVATISPVAVLAFKLKGRSKTLLVPIHECRCSSTSQTRRLRSMVNVFVCLGSSRRLTRMLSAGRAHGQSMGNARRCARAAAPSETYGLSLKVIAADPLNVILQNESPSLSFYSQFSGDLSSDRNSMTGRWNGRPAPRIFRRVP
jgi:hypothetical protein